MEEDTFEIARISLEVDESVHAPMRDELAAHMGAGALSRSGLAIDLVSRRHSQEQETAQQSQILEEKNRELRVKELSRNMGIIFGLLSELPSVSAIKTTTPDRHYEVVFDRNNIVDAKTCQANLAWLSLRYKDIWSQRTNYYPYYLIGAHSTDQSSLLLAPAFVGHSSNEGVNPHQSSVDYKNRKMHEKQPKISDIYEVSVRKNVFEKIKEHQGTYRFSDYKPEEIDQIYDPDRDELVIKSGSPGSISLASKPVRGSGNKHALPLREYWPVKSITDRVLADFSVLQSLIDLAVAFDKSPQLDKILAKAQDT